MEQRFGRIHRIGQREVCHLWNLVAADTREGDVYRTLLDKLEQARFALGGQVFDVLWCSTPSWTSPWGERTRAGVWQRGPRRKGMAGLGGRLPSVRHLQSEPKVLPQIKIWTAPAPSIFLAQSPTSGITVSNAPHDGWR